MDAAATAPTIPRRARREVDASCTLEASVLPVDSSADARIVADTQRRAGCRDEPWHAACRLLSTSRAGTTMLAVPNIIMR